MTQLHMYIVYLYHMNIFMHICMYMHVIYMRGCIWNSKYLSHNPALQRKQPTAAELTVYVCMYACRYIVVCMCIFPLNRKMVLTVF